ncbi:serine/threonine-protein kinase [Streptomyces sp. YIM 130001]|uniref:serine/threonine-protein kinase n=1 Tax=Streptomyces sp. YIM 130001 TaxID=2259644 RepID=UPI0019696E69|nr:serine/threonine-protein kinase [Streptomyces sp. YIM 130001]
MGTVWRAQDELLHREVAVKEVRAPAGLPAADVERLYARLEREAWAAARITHRGVVTVYDVAGEEQRPWIVMELVRGLSLAEVLEAEGPLTTRRAAHIGAELLSALRAAHEAGVLHRDVKPANVLLANDGRVVLTDFGIARLEGTSALTMTGEMVGSPEFLAPEQALGETPRPESDLWSLGVLLYAATEGLSPFRQETPLSTLRAVVDDELPPPRRAGVLAPLVQGLLHKDPAQRLAAESAERDLRLIAAGGAPRGSAAASGAPDRPAAGLPTVTRGAASEAGGSASTADPSAPAEHGSPAPHGDNSGSQPSRSRQTTALIVAGVAALVLAVSGLAYVLLDRDAGTDGRGGGGGGTEQGRSDGGRQGGEEGKGGSGGAGDTTSPAPDDGSTDDGAGGGEQGSGGDGEGDSDDDATTPPPQSVRAHVMAVRGDYTGSCPPSGAEAPSFRATITVGRTPARVQYRWVTRSGAPTDPAWKTVQFAAEGGKSKEVSHTETGHDPDGTVRNRIGVEVRQPLAVRSETIAYSLTCEQEPPTGGGSYTPNAR